MFHIPMMKLDNNQRIMMGEKRKAMRRVPKCCPMKSRKMIDTEMPMMAPVILA